MGRLFGHGGRTERQWIAGDRKIPPTVAVLLRLMLRGKITAADIKRAKR